MVRGCSWSEVHKKGLSGMSDFCWRAQWIAVSVMSSVKW
jgi:hypothetical protein